MKVTYTIHAAEKDPLAGWYARVTNLSGSRTFYGTSYYPTAKQANEAATAWVQGRLEMEEASHGPIPLG